MTGLFAQDVKLLDPQELIIVGSVNVVLDEWIIIGNY